MDAIMQYAKPLADPGKGKAGVVAAVIRPGAFSLNEGGYGVVAARF